MVLHAHSSVYLHLMCLCFGTQYRVEIFLSVDTISVFLGISRLVSNVNFGFDNDLTLGLKLLFVTQCRIAHNSENGYALIRVVTIT